MTIELHSDTIYGSFEEISGNSPNKTAIIYLGENYSYARLKEMVLSLAASLLRLGIGEEDKVILYLYNIPQTIIAFLALQRLGAVPVPVAPVYSSYDLKYMANDCGAESIFCMDSNFNYVNEIIPETSLKRTIVTNMVDLIPWWKKMLARGFDRVPRGIFPSGKGIFSFMNLLPFPKLHWPVRSY